MTNRTNKQQKAWLNVIGFGEDGVFGLSPSARAAIVSSGAIVATSRFHSMVNHDTAERIVWPSPFDVMVRRLVSLKPKNPVVLVTGDPLWYSAGARLTRLLPPDEIIFHPHLSSFQYAACRLGWSLADCETLTVHGRAATQIIPHFCPSNRLLVLGHSRSTPKTISSLLCENGFGDSRMTVFAHLGGDNERRFDGLAKSWRHRVPDFHILAIECQKNPVSWYPRVGLPDSAFLHDGQLTKREVRAMTLMNLSPYPDAVLWDIGAGCGSVGIEWMRSSRGAVAVAIEKNPKRAGYIRRNSKRLGVEKIQIIESSAPGCLGKKIPEPDAIFIGGGLLTRDLFKKCWSRLRLGGRLVVNVVTIESENFLVDLRSRHGGELVRLGVSRCESLGGMSGYRPLMPVTQWSVTKVS